MINKNTVIITGAGANKDYNFPTGNELIIDICENYLSLYDKHITKNDKLATDSHLLETELKGSKDFVKESKDFIKAFSDANIQIDKFISVHKDGPKYDKYAKHAIILTLIEHEFRNRDKIKDKWLERLYIEMTNGLNESGHKELNKNKITFITFNYDRVIEYFFIRRTMDQYKVYREEAYDLIKQINFIHVYGMIDNIPPFPKSWTNFGNDGNPIGNMSWVLRRNIDLVRENDDVDVKHLKSYYNIQSALKKAERLIFLGYGFNKYNSKEVLNLPESIKNVRDLYMTRRDPANDGFDEIFKEIFKYQSDKFITKESCEDLINCIFK